MVNFDPLVEILGKFIDEHESEPVCLGFTRSNHFLSFSESLALGTKG